MHSAVEVFLPEERAATQFPEEAYPESHKCLSGPSLSKPATPPASLKNPQPDKPELQVVAHPACLVRGLSPEIHRNTP